MQTLYDWDTDKNNTVVNLHKNTGDLNNEAGDHEEKQIDGWLAESFLDDLGLYKKDVDSIQKLVRGYFNSISAEEIDMVLLEETDALMYYFGGRDDRQCKDKPDAEELEKALLNARQRCQDHARDENNHVIEESLVRWVRGSL
jgi:hypothetical protein